MEKKGKEEEKQAWLQSLCSVPKVLHSARRDKKTKGRWTSTKGQGKNAGHGPGQEVW